MEMDTNIYINFIKKTIADEGIKVADKANKIALELKAITHEQYCKAALEIVKVILAE